MAKIVVKTHGPMAYFPLRHLVEDYIAKTRLSKGLTTVSVEGATPGLIIASRRELDRIDEALKRLVPVTGWKHGNAYAHLRSIVMSTTQTIPFIDKKLLLPEDYQLYLVETRPVHNHDRTVLIYIRGIEQEEKEA